MVIETMRENEISPSRSKYIEKRGALQQNLEKRRKMKGLNWGRQIPSENEK